MCGTLTIHCAQTRKPVSQRNPVRGFRAFLTGDNLNSINNVKIPYNNPTNCTIPHLELLVRLL